MTDKNWNYAQITKAAEDRIRSLMVPTDIGPDHADIRQQWAYGVYLGWYHLTTGWQQDGDSERLEALTNKQEG